MEAEVGVQTLIDELVTQLSLIETTTAKKKWKIVIASGTGMTNLWPNPYLILPNPSIVLPILPKHFNRCRM